MVILSRSVNGRPMSSIASQGRDAPHAEPSEVVMPPLPRFFLSSGLKTHPDLEAQTSIATPSEVPGCPVARRHRRAKPSSPTRLLPVRRRRHRPRQLCSCTNGVAWPPATTNSLSPTALPPSSAPASPGHVYWETRHALEGPIACAPAPWPLPTVCASQAL
jgi:hypothetical protein